MGFCWFCSVNPSVVLCPVSLPCFVLSHSLRLILSLTIFVVCVFRLLRCCRKSFLPSKQFPLCHFSLSLPVILDPQAAKGEKEMVNPCSSLFLLIPLLSLSSILYLCLSIFSLLLLSSLKLIQPLQLDHSFILSSFPFAFHVFPSFLLLLLLVLKFAILYSIPDSSLQFLYLESLLCFFLLLSLFVSCLCMLYVDGSHTEAKNRKKFWKSERTRWRSFFVIQDTEHTDQETSKRETARKKRRRKTEQVLQKER